MTNNVNNLMKLDLRKFPKSVRLVINSKREEINSLLESDLKALFSKSNISKDDFINLFKKHYNNILLNGSFEIEKIRFKKDNTPDLRSLPISVRSIFKSFKDASELEKKSIIGRDLDTIMAKRIETLTNEDFTSIMNSGNINFFTKKWEASSSRELA